MKPISYTWIGIIIAVCFWFFDSAVHFFFYEEHQFEWVPSEFNEFWMRSTIIVLIIAMGIFAQSSTQKRLRIEREKLELQKKLNDVLQAKLEAQKKQTELTKETVLQMYDTVNNSLNNLLLLKLEAESSLPHEALNTESLEKFDELLHETSLKIRKLGESAMKKSSHQAGE